MPDSLSKQEHDIYYKRMKSLTKVTDDIERAMSLADKMLCDILIKLGYGDIVGEYKKIGW
jgi:hypothetical protein